MTVLFVTKIISDLWFTGIDSTTSLWQTCVVELATDSSCNCTKAGSGNSLDRWYHIILTRAFQTLAAYIGAFIKFVDLFAFVVSETTVNRSFVLPILKIKKNCGLFVSFIQGGPNKLVPYW